jgi:hypothetical protein
MIGFLIWDLLFNTDGGRYSSRPPYSSRPERPVMIKKKKKKNKK